MRSSAISHTVHGNVSGLQHSVIRALERIYRRKSPPGLLITDELGAYMAKLSREIGRQIGLLIDRKGRITHVIIGNDSQIVIPNLGQRRVAGKRLAGFRCIHTHLKAEPITQDDLNDLLLLRLDAMAVVESRPDGLPGKWHLAHIEAAREDSYTVHGGLSSAQIADLYRGLTERIEKELEHSVTAKKVETGQSALLIHVSNQSRSRMDVSLEELGELARSAGIDVAGQVTQRKETPDPKYLMGHGKMQEFMIKALSLGVDMVIFDTELTPAQIKAISDFTDLEVLDRSQLILGIFEKRATSRDGKVRVQLAQMKYLLPRLGAKESALSRIRGGIGLRGPGETTAEVQRRHLQNRITQFERELEKLKERRIQKRKRRGRNEMMVVSILGYTNAGKSTLLNRLTGSDVIVKDQLFATLDPSTRQLWLPNGQHVVISDTVGLIRAMPESLRGVFRATLEELAESDLLINVADIANPELDEHLKVTGEIIEDIGLGTIPLITVFNKIEMVERDEADNLCRRHDALGISAATGEGIGRLIDEIQLKLFK